MNEKKTGDWTDAEFYWMSGLWWLEALEMQYEDWYADFYDWEYFRDV